MTEERRHSQEYEKTELDEARCPDCGNEDGNTKTERANSKTKPIPPERQVRCPECGHTDSHIAFGGAYKWARMSEAERAEAKRKAEEHAGRMAEHQETATSLAEQREP